MLHAVKWIALLALLASAFVLQPPMLAPARAQANNVTNTVTVPIAVVLVNPCTVPPDPVALTGTTHIVSQVTFDPSGRVHILLRSTTHVSGVGASGTEYQGMRQGAVKAQLDEPGEVTIERSFRDRLIAQGREGDLVVSGKIRVTIDATGQVIKAEVVDPKIECQ